jgi:glycosyltransferase involved in cell wall biosynthesis
VDLFSISRRRRWTFDKEHDDRLTIYGSPDLFWGRGRTGWDPWDVFRRTLRVRRQRYDLVHAFDSRPAVIIPALAAQSRRTPLVLDWADWWGRGGTIEERPASGAVRKIARPIETFFEERFRTRADGTTVISSALADRVASLGVPAERILRIPQGSDVVAVVPRDRDASRMRLNLPLDVPIVGYLGVLLNSDAALLAGAWRGINGRHPDARLVMIGNPKTVLDGPEVTMTGFVPRDEMVSYLAACDVLLLPMKNTIASRGRWPSKLNDYMAAGRPVAATAVGDSTVLFGEEGIGVATADDPGAFAAGVSSLLNNAEQRKRMGERARSIAENQFAWPALTQRLEAYYQMVIDRVGGVAE